MTGILALLLPIATREQLWTSAAARKRVLSISVMIAVTGLAVEGSGAAIDHGVKVELLRVAARGR